MNEKTNKKKARRRGRPKGSKNNTEMVRSSPTRCQRCYSTDIELRGQIRKPDESHGFERDGLPRTSVTWHKCKCKAEGCGLWSVVRVPHFDPSKWVGALPKAAGGDADK